jgi:5-methylcytosine-specific restriction endonuclease McrA
MKRGICTYCGKTGAVTSDHPIPRSLFAKPRPVLITVPSCQDCNNGFSLNDEYLRLVLVSRHDTFKHPDAQSVWGAAMRGLSRPDHLGVVA